MVITVTCPSCSSAFPVDPAKIPEGGVNARCSACGDVFRVEKPSEAEPLPTLEDVAPPPIPEPEAAPAEEAPVEEPVVEESFEAPADDFAAPAETDWAAEPAAEAEPAVADPLPEMPEPVVEEAPAEDPFAEAAPFEAAEESVVEEAAEAPAFDAAPAEEAAPAEPEPAPADEAPAESAPVQGFTFGKRDPTDKAKRLARVLVSDMIMYNAERHQSALAEGTLVEDFEEEIEKSWKEFIDQVGEELANGPGKEFWTDALNDILAKGEQVF